MENKEYIICAAIHNPADHDMTGAPLIYCGHRHNNILWQGTHISRKLHHQGFLTNTGRYVSREEGMEIAYLAKQIPERKIMLYSEDLY